MVEVLAITFAMFRKARLYKSVRLQLPALEIEVYGNLLCLREAAGGNMLISRYIVRDHFPLGPLSALH